MRRSSHVLVLLLLAVANAGAQNLQVPTLVEIEQVRAGNPLASYARLVELADDYRKSPFAGIYDEVRLMAEEFLGVPDAGLRAMSTVGNLRTSYPAGETALPTGSRAESALAVIGREAVRTRIVIWGEEHHLPQTRSLYAPMLHMLRAHGYRYLAAETFSDSVMAPGFRYPTAMSGVYLRDPIFASAVREAIDLGFTLVAYEETRQAPAGDGSYRDRRQAENIKARIFDRDPEARVLVLAGRGHASEAAASDGWTPMASVLKQITGVDPFTVSAVRMGERFTSPEEDPRYRFASARGLLSQPTIFTDSMTNRPLGDASFDAYLFWPRTQLVEGRPDWMMTVLGRRRVAVDTALQAGKGLRLVQAFREGEPANAIPVDQVLLGGPVTQSLMLPNGNYWLRTIDPTGAVIAAAKVRVDATGATLTR